MKERLKQILDNMKKYNDGCMSRECFGFEPGVVYDAIVVASGWKPTKIIHDDTCRVTHLTQHSYFAGYLVEKDDLKMIVRLAKEVICVLLRPQRMHLPVLTFCGRMIHFRKPKVEIGG